jgi:hypothetical protein
VNFLTAVAWDSSIIKYLRELLSLQIERPKMFLGKITFNSIVDGTFAFFYLLQDPG